MMYCIVQNFGGENFGELGKMIVISQYFAQPNSRFTIVTNGSYCKFANVFFTKTLKQSIRQSFTPPTFCTIRYSSVKCIMLTINEVTQMYVSKEFALLQSHTQHLVGVIINWCLISIQRHWTKGRGLSMESQ